MHHTHNNQEHDHEKANVCTGGCCDTHDTKDVTNASAYTCPMHPEVVQDKPGMCPECGMNLVKK